MNKYIFYQIHAVFLFVSSKADTHPLHRDHSAMELSSVQVADTFGGLLCGGHGDESIAASSRALCIGHHLSSNDLQE